MPARWRCTCRMNGRSATTGPSTTACAEIATRPLATEGQLSPRMGVVWNASDSTTVHAGYSRYFTPPASELIASSDIALYDGTTNQQPSGGNNTPLAERSDYYDIGVSQQVGDHLTLGWTPTIAALRACRTKASSAPPTSTRRSTIAVATSVGWSSVPTTQRPFSAYFNAAYNKAIGTQVITSQYNLDPDALAYVADHWIHLDHDQKRPHRVASATPLPDTTGSVPTTCSAAACVRTSRAYPTAAAAVVPAGEPQRRARLQCRRPSVARPTGRDQRTGSQLPAARRWRCRRLRPQWGPRRGAYLSLQQSFCSAGRWP